MSKTTDKIIAILRSIDTSLKNLCSAADQAGDTVGPAEVAQGLMVLNDGLQTIMSGQQEQRRVLAEIVQDVVSGRPKAQYRRVVIESPFGSDLEQTVERNVEYARLCLRESLRRGEAPYASHLLYTQVLDDCLPEEREHGIAAGFSWGEAASLVAVYCDLGISMGMERGVKRGLAAKQTVEYRSLPPTMWDPFGAKYNITRSGQCPHEARDSHELYLAHDGSTVCRACGMSWKNIGEACPPK